MARKKRNDNDNNFNSFYGFSSRNLFFINRLDFFIFNESYFLGWIMVEENNNKNKNNEEVIKSSEEQKDSDKQQQENQNDSVNNVEENLDKITNTTEDQSKEEIQEQFQENENQTNDKKEEVLENEQETNKETKAKWYVVQAHSGFEDKAAENIKENARKKSLSHFFEEFEIPTHDIIEMKRGKKVTKEKKFFPGYMLVKMEMNNDTWQLVKKSNKVSCFVGNDHKPIPLSTLEAMKILKKADKSVEYIAPKINYEVGEQVKVSDGPFASFNGLVEEVDEDKGKLKVSVSIFGRSTPVELDYTQVEKM